MAASIQINGVTQQVAVVPYGSTVTLTNAAPTGTSQKWEILDYPLDLDDAGPDFATNFSAWTLAGDGSYFINQTPAYTAVTFKPDVTGAFLIRLTSVEMSGSVTQQAVVRVTDVQVGEHLAAAGETTESSTREGWKRAINGRMKRLGKRMQGFVRVANISGSSIARGKVVKIVGTVDAHTVAPNTNPGGSAAAKPEKLFSVQVADNTAAGAATADYAILDETIANNGTGWASKFGLFEGKTDVSYNTFSPDDLLYLDSSGGQVNVAPGSGAVVVLGSVLETTLSAGTAAIRLAGPRYSAAADGSVVFTGPIVGVGVLASDAQHGVRGGGSQHSAVTTSTNGFMLAADKLKLDSLTGSWATTNTRYYAVDSAATDDSAAGFSDVSATAAFAVAKKTWGGLMAILPPVGENRDVLILIKAGAYAESLVLAGLSGYRNLHVVGSTDGSDNATDRIKSGFVTSSAGPGGSGEWTCAAGATTSSLTISTGSLPAEFTATAKRIRFTGNVTSALANVCTVVYSNTTSGITFGVALGTAPANGDTFFIEHAGAVFSSVDVRNVQATALWIRGARTSGAWTMSNVQTTAGGLVGCDAASSSSFTDVQLLNQVRTYTGIDATDSLVGAGFRSAGTMNMTRVQAANGDSSAILSTSGNTWNAVRAGVWGGGSTILGNLVLTGCGTNNDSSQFVIGSNLVSGVKPLRVTGTSAQLAPIGAMVVFAGVDLSRASGGPGIRVFGVGGRIGLQTVTGSVGGGYVVQLHQTLSTVVSVNPGCTATGSPSEIGLGPQSGGPLQASFSDLDRSNVIDDNGNDVRRYDPSIASVIHPAGLTSCTRVKNVSGGSLVVGAVVRKTGITNEVTSAQADTLAHATGALLVMVTTTPNTSEGYAIALAGHGVSANFDAAPTIGALAYLAPGTAGVATTTVPTMSGTNQKRRLGYVVAASGSTGTLSGDLELLAVTADGLA